MIIFIILLAIILFFYFIIYKKIERFETKQHFKDFIRNKTILITCSTNGIGYELAKLFNKYECNIVITGRSEDKVIKIEKELKQLNPNVLGISADLTDSEQVQSLFKKSVDKFKIINYLINIPLINTGSKFIREKNIKDWKNDFNININAIYQLTQLCIKHMNYNKVEGKILTVIAELNKKKSNNSQILLQNMIEQYNKMISNEVYNYNIAVTTIKISIPQSSSIYSKLPDNLPRLKNILDIFKSIDSIAEVSIKKILQVFTYALQSPANKINGRTISSKSFLNERFDSEMSLVVDEHQFNLNDEVYSKIKYQKTKENAVVLSKQNPYACSNDIIELYKKGGLPLNHKTTFSKYNAKIIELIAQENDIKPSNICLFKNEYDAMQKILRIFVSGGNSIVTHYPSYSLLELICKENKINVLYILLKEMDKINIQPKLNELKDKIKSTDIKLIYLSSPNLVSGQELLEEDFNKILQVIPENIIIVIDQTYVDFISNSTFNPINYIDRNIIILRTFSNFYSVENLELSYVISNDSFIKFITDTQVINPINNFTDTLAVKSFSDKKYKMMILNKINEEKNRMCSIFNKHNIHYFPSDTNYLLVELSVTKEDFIKELYKMDIILYESNDGFASYVTIPVSTKDINNKVLDIIIMFS